MYRVYWGAPNYYVDITSILYNKFPGEFILPDSDWGRVIYFNDHIVGTHKHFKLVDIETGEPYYIVDNQDLPITTFPEYITVGSNNYECPFRKLTNLHRNIYFLSDVDRHDSNMRNEYMEQVLAIKYLKPENRVLEIGSNCGRNSLIISSIVDNNNFVTLETDPHSYAVLCKNRDINNRHFYCENSALSKYPLAQKEWDTIPCPNGIIPPGYKKVNTITLDTLRNKYNVEFDTLILDCEGAFYYIIHDFPDILNNIRLIIVENDYKIIEHELYVRNILTNSGFKSVFNICPNYYYGGDTFYQVFIR